MQNENDLLSLGGVNLIIRLPKSPFNICAYALSGSIHTSHDMRQRRMRKKKVEMDQIEMWETKISSHYPDEIIIERRLSTTTSIETIPVSTFWFRFPNAKKKIVLFAVLMTHSVPKSYLLINYYEIESQALVIICGTEVKWAKHDKRFHK